MTWQDQRSHPGTDKVLQPVMPIVDEPVDWDGATWVGQIDEADLDGDRVRLADGQRFGRARLLVWSADQPRGAVEVALDHGLVDLAAVRREAQRLPVVPLRSPEVTRPPISIVICTRDRPEHLTNALGSVYGLEYPEFEVVVVDNNPASGLTPPVVAAHADLPVRVVPAVGQGLSVARNVGLRNARYDIVAFTDDDVVLDRRWLTNLAYGFARDERVGCVCGMVPTSELLTPAQAYFDQRVGWAQRWQPALYDLGAHVGDGLFPLQISEFGTGANFAVRRDVAVGLGGFDEALGAGAPAGSGEDIDMFLRIMLAGRLLVREPAAVVWHSHRRTVPELESQMHNYGVGLSAWLVKLLMRPRTCLLVVRRLLVGIRHLARVTVVEDLQATAAEPALQEVKGYEFRGVLRGPWRLLSGRLAGRRRAPLAPPGRLGGFFDIRHGRMWGDPGIALLPGRLAVIAAVLSVAGALTAVDALPSAVRTLLLAAFIAGGPGALIMSCYTRLPGYAIAALVPVVGVATCILTVSGLLMAGFYSPPTVLLGLALTTLAAALVRCRQLARIAAEAI